ncbi:MAG: hypothetical protein PVSMB4_07200 [Ktedonobacterales bacterium]
MASRSALRAWGIGAGTAWLVVGGYAYLVAPRGALAVLAGFALLYVALATTLVPVCRWVSLRLPASPLHRDSRRRDAVRQGLLLALLVVANLALLAARAWTPLALLLGLVALGIEEALAWARK